MSVRLLGQIIGDKQVPGIDLPASHRDVLLALANHANADDQCFPGNILLQYESRLSERQVRRVLRCLETCVACSSGDCQNPMPIIEPIRYRKGGRTSHGAGRATEYQMHLDRAPKLPLFEVWRTQQSPASKGAMVTPLQRSGSAPSRTVTDNREPVHNPLEGGHGGPLKGAIEAGQGGHPCGRKGGHPCGPPTVINRHIQETTIFDSGTPEREPVDNLTADQIAALAREARLQLGWPERNQA